MEYFREYALLIAVAVPVVAIIGLNLFLALMGERGTLLLPSSPSMDSRTACLPEVAQELPDSGNPKDPTLVVKAANDDSHLEEAA